MIHSCVGVTSILSRLSYPHLQLLSYIMGRFRVSHSCMGVASNFSRLFYTRIQIMSLIMGSFRMSHSCLIYIPQYNSALAMFSWNHISLFYRYTTLFNLNRVNLTCMSLMVHPKNMY